MTTAPATVIAVPCHNEAERLDPGALAELAAQEGVSLVLVDDGSSDGTRSMLRTIETCCPSRISVLCFDRNSGKAHAVRAGLRRGIECGAAWVGFLDADLAVPVPEMVRLLGRRGAGVDVVLASRVRLLGRHIERRALRHVAGRAFASFASLLLRLPVYDTQCGAKLLRVTPALRSALDEPFKTTWLFDVELIARLLEPPTGVAPIQRSQFVEVPLRRWTDVPGGGLSLRSARTVLRECWCLQRDIRRRGRTRR